MRLLLASATVLFGACHFDVSGFPALGDGLDSGDATAYDGGSVDSLTPAAFSPAHVSPSDIENGAASLSGAQDIDTDALTIDGRTPPPGVLFHAEASNDGWAILAVHDFTVTSDVTVHGRRALLVVAVGSIEIDAIMHAEAQQRAPGPGGDYTGMGRGSDGKHSSGADSGGGGAGHGAAGAPGGDSTAKTNDEGGPAGVAYGGPSDLFGGSGGGDGAGASGGQQPCPSGANWSLGGAGGGAIQLSAKLELRIAASGGINASGGGGGGGCKESASAGGGGGSGGTVWLEAPTMTLDGKVAANGGGGGSGGDGSSQSPLDASDGQDGRLDVAVAAGGGPSGNSGGGGGAGGATTTPPAQGAEATNAGGGGGAVGAIRIRTREVSPITSATTILSPAPIKSVDF